MRERLKAMSQQKIFLCDQLKAIMKRNKVLEAEIEVAEARTAAMNLDSLPAFHSQQGSTKGGKGGIVLSSKYPVKKASGGHYSEDASLEGSDDDGSVGGGGIEGGGGVGEELQQGLGLMSTNEQEELMRKLDRFEDEYDNERGYYTIGDTGEGEEDYGFDYDHAYEEEDELLSVGDNDEVYRSTSPQQSRGRERQSRGSTGTRNRSSPKGMKRYNTEPANAFGGLGGGNSRPNTGGRTTSLSPQRSLSPAQMRLQIASRDMLLEQLVVSGKVTSTHFLPPVSPGKGATRGNSGKESNGGNSKRTGPSQLQLKERNTLYSRQVKSMPNLEFGPKKTHKDLLHEIRDTR